MALIAQVPVIDVSIAVARALESILGHDIILATGAPEFGAPSRDALPGEPTRAIALPFTSAIHGEVTLVVSAAFASVLEAANPDAELTAATVPALEAAAAAIEATLPVGANPDYAGEIAIDTLLSSMDGDFAVVPILENDTHVAAVVVRVVDEAPIVPDPALLAEPASPPPAPIEVEAFEEPEPVQTPELPIAVPVPAVAAPAGISRHEFQPIGDGQVSVAQPRSLTLLNDVSMEVTAELGRRRIKVREIMSLQPGSVIELDKTAGSPVDVLVNGALVWHGEVVVVDDEFGIRVSETVVDDI